MGSDRFNYYNYFTEIEEHFVKRRGKHLLVSPMDWGLIAAWRDAGVPLQVALRGIDIAMDGFFSRQRRGSSKINSLCYCHDSVMAEYEAYRESRIGESEAVSGTGTDSPESAPPPDNRDESEIRESLEYVASIIEELEALPSKQPLSDAVLEGLGRVRDRLKAMILPFDSGGRVDLETLERDLGIADALLVETLLAAIGEDQTAEWEKEAKTELKIYKKKLPKEMYAKIQENFLRGRIHQKFDIREFSLFRL